MNVIECFINFCEYFPYIIDKNLENDIKGVYIYCLHCLLRFIDLINYEKQCLPSEEKQFFINIPIFHSIHSHLLASVISNVS